MKLQLILLALLVVFCGHFAQSIDNKLVDSPAQIAFAERKYFILADGRLRIFGENGIESSIPMPSGTVYGVAVVTYR